MHKEGYKFPIYILSSRIYTKIPFCLRKFQMDEQWTFGIKLIAKNNEMQKYYDAMTD